MLNFHFLKKTTFVPQVWKQGEADKQLQAGGRHSKAQAVEHGHLRRIWRNLADGSKYYS